MNVTIENLSGCRKVLRVEVEAEKVLQAFEDAASKIQGEAKLAGFRPGKAPKALILKTFSKAIEDEARKELLRKSYAEVLKEKNIRAMNRPEIEETLFDKEKGYQFTIKLETTPDFVLPEYKGLPAKKQTRVVTESDMERAVTVLRDKVATYTDVERPLKEGDFAVINYSGTTDGKPLTEIAPAARGLTSKTNSWLEIKPGSFIPGFTEQLVGASKGEKRTVNVDFPQDFVAPQLSGLKGVYEVELVQVKEKSLPELNDEFAKKYGAETFEQLRENIRTDLQRDLESKIRQNVREQVVEALARQIECELPESMVNGETRNAVYNIVAENKQRGITDQEIDQHKDEIYSNAASSAKERLKIAFIFGRVADKEGISASQKEIMTEVLRIAEQRGEKPEKLLKEFKKNGVLDQIHEHILFSKVTDFLEKNAKIEEVAPPSEPVQA